MWELMTAVASFEDLALESGPANAELVARARAGEREAFDALAMRYQPLVDAYTRQLLEDLQAAEDVTQEAFLRAFRELNSLRDPDRFGAWLKSITWRECRAWVRKKKAERARRGVEREHEPHSAADLADPWLQEEEAAPDPWLERLDTALESMHEGRKAVFALFYLKGMPHERIAEFLDIPVGTVKRRLFEGRRELAAVAGQGEALDLEERRRFVAALQHRLGS